MKVLHLNQHLSWSGGVETYLLSLIPELERRGHEQAAAVASGTSAEVGARFDMPSLNKADRRSESDASRAMEDVLELFSPDIVHVHQVYNIGAIRACLGRVPVILHAHDHRYECPASTRYYRRAQEECGRVCGLGCFATTLRKRCMTWRIGTAMDYFRRVKWVARHAGDFSAVIAPSGAARLRYLEAGFSSDRVHVLPYFCPIPVAEAPRELPQQPTVLFVGRIREYKGVRYFIDALSMLPATVKGVMVGDFTDQSLARVKGQAADRGCADRLETRGWAAHADVAEVYRQATVFAFPSIWPETLGIVGLEALANGVPVVGTDIGGVGEWLHSGQTGFLVPAKSGRELARAMERLLFDESLNRSMGQNGLDLVRGRFGRVAHVEGLLGVYGSVGRGSGVGAR